METKELKLLRQLYRKIEAALSLSKDWQKQEQLSDMRLILEAYFKGED